MAQLKERMVGSTSGARSRTLRPQFMKNLATMIRRLVRDPRNECRWNTDTLMDFPFNPLIQITALIKIHRISIRGLFATVSCTYDHKKNPGLRIKRDRDLAFGC